MASDSKLPEYFGATELDTPATALEDEGGSERASQLEHTPDGISVEFLTEALRGRRLVDDIATAANGSGRSLFAGWREKVNGALNDGYAVYLHILSGGPAAVEQVLNDPNFPPRKRGHRKNLALIALQLSAQPKDEAQFKACSEYAPLFKWAALREIHPKDFAVRMTQVRLKDAKTFIRSLKKAVPAATLEPDQAPPESTLPPPEVPETEAEFEVPEQAPEPSSLPSKTPDPASVAKSASTPVSEPVANLPPSSPAPPSSPLAMPKTATGEKDDRVQSPPVTGITLTIVSEAGKRTGRWRLTPAQLKAVLAVDHRQLRNPAAYLYAVAEALKGQPPAKGAYSRFAYAR